MNGPAAIGGRKERRGALIRGVAAAGAAWLIWLACAQLPQAARKPLLLPLAVGGLSGAAAACLPRALGGAAARCRWQTAAAVALGLAAAAAGNLWRGFHDVSTRAAGQLARLEDPPLEQEFELLFSQAPPDQEAAAATQQAEARAQFEAGRRLRAAQRNRLEALRTLPGYLGARIPAAWGSWPTPWPLLFWLLELVLSSAFGGYAACWCDEFFRRAPSEPKQHGDC
jgi:hypothetical protein